MLLWYHTSNPHTHTHLLLWSINFMANPSADWVLKVKAPSLRVCKHDPAARPQREARPFKRTLFIREPFVLNYSMGNPALTELRPKQPFLFFSVSVMIHVISRLPRAAIKPPTGLHGICESVAHSFPPPPLQ